MRKIIICVVLLLLSSAPLLFFSSCSNKKKQQEIELPSCVLIDDEYSPENAFYYFIRNNVPLESLSIYNFDELNQWVGDRGRVVIFVSDPDTLGRFYEDHLNKIENIQMIDDTHLALVLKVKADNIKEAYALVVFKKIKFTGYYWHDLWTDIHQLYFIDEVHSSKDYSKIRIGDSVDRLYEIDESIHYDVLRKDKSYEWYMMDPEEKEQHANIANERAMIYKLLSDKIMTVEYECQNMTIRKITFIDYSENNWDKTIDVNSPDFLKVFNKDSK